MWVPTNKFAKFGLSPPSEDLGRRKQMLPGTGKTYLGLPGSETQTPATCCSIVTTIGQCHPLRTPCTLPQTCWPAPRLTSGLHHLQLSLEQISACGGTLVTTTSSTVKPTSHLQLRLPELFIRRTHEKPGKSFIISFKHKKSKIWSILKTYLNLILYANFKILFKDSQSHKPYTVPAILRGEKKGLESIRLYNNLMVLAYSIINECKAHYFKEPWQFAHFLVTTCPKNPSLKEKDFLYSHPVCSVSIVPCADICKSFILLILIPIQSFFTMQTASKHMKVFSTSP